MLVLFLIETFEIRGLRVDYRNVLAFCPANVPEIKSSTVFPISISIKSNNPSFMKKVNHHL